MSELKTNRLEELRTILLSEDQQKIRQLEGEIAHLRSELSDKEHLLTRFTPVFDELIDRKASHSAEELAEALRPVFKEFLRQKGHGNDEDVTILLAPVIRSVFSHELASNPRELNRIMAPVIREGIRHQTLNAQDDFAKTLAPVISEGIRHQIRDAKADVVDALYPILGQMVSRSVAEAMKKLVASINQTLDKTFDFQVWSRRMKARLSGANPAEAVLAGAVPFFIEKAFLISKQSGLLMAYYSANQENEVERDAQVIGGMLTAIKAFVEDAFDEEGDGGELKEIEHSNKTIKLDSARYTYLAVVCEGPLSLGFDDVFRNYHHSIHDKFFRKLRDYDGDNSSLLGVEQILKDLCNKTRNG